MATAELNETSTQPNQWTANVLIDRLPIVLTTVALLIGTGLRWAQLGARSFWFDEGYTAWMVSNPMREIIRLIRVDTAPPLYYLILREWTVLFGRSEAGMRSLSAVFATLNLLLCWAIAHRLFKNRWAVSAAVWLCSISFMQIAYAHEARFYAMMGFLGALDLYLVLVVCEKSSPPRLAVLILAWTVSLYTNNMMAVYLGFLGLAWLIAPGDRPVRRRLIDAVIVGGVSAMLFAPWVPSMLAQMAAVRGHFWPEIPKPMDLENTIAAMVGVRDPIIGDFSFMHRLVLGTAALDGFLLTIVLVTLRSWRQTASALALMIFGLGPILFIYLYSQHAQSIYMDRAFLISSGILPIVALLPLTAPIGLGPQRVLGAGALLLIWFTANSLTGQRLGTQDEDWRGAMQWAIRSPAKHRMVVFVANEGELFYDYYLRHGDYTPRPDLVGVPSGFFETNPPRTMRHVYTDQDLNSFRQLVSAGQYDELVFVASHSWFSDAKLLTLSHLKSKLPLLDQKSFGRMTIFRFNSDPHTK